MGIGAIFHGVMAVTNLLVGNVPGAITEGLAATKSYAVGKILSPITDPIKDFAGEAIADTDWSDVADVSALW